MTVKHMLPYEADLPEGLDLSFTVVGDKSWLSSCYRSLFGRLF